MGGDRQLIILASSTNQATKYKYAEVLKLPFDVGDAENGSQLINSNILCPTDEFSANATINFEQMIVGFLTC